MHASNEGIKILRWHAAHVLMRSKGVSIQWIKTIIQNIQTYSEEPGGIKSGLLGFPQCILQYLGSPNIHTAPWS